ncbi:MAG TPA: cupredoxin domain-containing protein [Rhodanobacteraceae bacterium]|jgi:plastocyanin|nr:cupredoxin domain-containing protein [Rhodanobacteraceae bacterium]
MRCRLRLAIIGAGICASAFALAAGPRDVTIKMQKEAFVPAQTTVAAGTHVTWTNDDSVPHSVTAADSRFDSGPILPGKTFEWTAEGSGKVNYHCIFHPSMTAILTVDATAGEATK